MIPKVIHYCWFGKNEIPSEYIKYIESWKIKCPDFEVKEWNEGNFDVNQNKFCKEAYDLKKWAFVSDYARLKILYDYGGIYLDTDVEIVKDLSPLINDGIGYMGFQNIYQVASGLGMASESGNSCIREMLSLYEVCNIKENIDKLNRITCPILNTVALKRCGLKTGRINSKNIQKLEELNIYPIEYFNPVNFDSKKIRCTQNTYTIHHYSASWTSVTKSKLRRLKQYFPEWILNFRTLYISKRDVKRLEKLVNEDK